MSIISVKENWEGLSASESVDSATVMRNFTVLFDGSDSTVVEPLLALGHSSIPKRWDTHPYSSWIYVQDRTISPIKPHYYEITITYASVDNPLEQPTVVEWDFVSSSEPIDRDIEGKPITNSSKETFDPPIQKEVDDLILRITRNEPTFNYLQAAEYKNAINSDTFNGFVAGKVKCNTYAGIESRAGGMWYWQVTYEFQIRWDGWKRRVLDEGYRTKAEGGDYQIITDSEDNPLSQPVQLDGNGSELAAGVAPVFLEFDLYRTKAFSMLGL